MTTSSPQTLLLKDLGQMPTLFSIQTPKTSASNDHPGCDSCSQIAGNGVGVTDIDLRGSSVAPDNLDPGTVMYLLDKRTLLSQSEPVLHRSIEGRVDLAPQNLTRLPERRTDIS